MQLTLQSCSDDHTGTMSPLNKVLQLRPEEIKQPSRQSICSFQRDFTGGKHRFSVLSHDGLNKS